MGAGAGVAAGSAIGGGLGLIGGNATNAANSAIAADQMAFQDFESRTQHQREVADLKAAGLNPILSAGGSGNSAMSGAAIPNINALGAAVSGATDAARTAKDIEVANASIDKTHADTILSGAQAAAALSSARKADADTANVKAGLGETSFLGNLGKAADRLFQKLETGAGNSAKSPTNVPIGDWKSPKINPPPRNPMMHQEIAQPSGTDGL